MQRYFMKEDYQEKDLYKVADENYHHMSNGTTKKEQPKKKDYKKLPQKRRSNRIGSRHQVFLWWKKHKKSLRNLTHMTQSWLRMKNQQNKEKKVN